MGLSYEEIKMGLSYEEIKMGLSYEEITTNLDEKRRNAYTKPKFASVKGSVPTGSKFCDGDNCEL